MRKLLLLPVTLPLAAVRGALDAAVRTLTEALGHDRDEPDDRADHAPAPTAPPVPEPTPPPARPGPSPPAAGGIHDDEPTRGEVGRRREAQREAEAAAGGDSGPGAEIRVDEPWQGYDGQTAPDIIARLIGADEATRAVVRLYETAHRHRTTVLRATED